MTTGGSGPSSAVCVLPAAGSARQQPAAAFHLPFSSLLPMFPQQPDHFAHHVSNSSVLMLDAKGRKECSVMAPHLLFLCPVVNF